MTAVTLSTQFLYIDERDMHVAIMRVRCDSKIYQLGIETPYPTHKGQEYVRVMRALHYLKKRLQRELFKEQEFIGWPI